MTRNSLLFFLLQGGDHEEIERATRSMTCLKAPSLDHADKRDANHPEKPSEGGSIDPSGTATLDRYQNSPLMA